MRISAKIKNIYMDIHITDIHITDIHITDICTNIKTGTGHIFISLVWENYYMYSTRLVDIFSQKTKYFKDILLVF